MGRQRQKKEQAKYGANKKGKSMKYLDLLDIGKFMFIACVGG